MTSYALPNACEGEMFIAAAERILTMPSRRKGKINGWIRVPSIHRIEMSKDNSTHTSGNAKRCLHCVASMTHLQRAASPPMGVLAKSLKSITGGYSDEDDSYYVMQHC
jgi:hypothetical protein